LLLGAIENLWENAPTACKNITLFVYLWCAAHDAHHTWHGDRGGPCHFLHPLTFLDRDKFVAKISKFDGLGGLYYHFCPDKHVITFIGAICCPCGAKTQYRHGCPVRRPAGNYDAQATKRLLWLVHWLSYYA